MKVKELIDKYEAAECVVDFVSGKTLLKNIRRDLEQLDEPEKVKIPEFMAEKIDYFKKTGDWDLFQAMDSLFGRKETMEWLEGKNNQELFALAWIFGYEVEKEKRYLVTLKNGQPLVKSQSWSTLYFSQDVTAGNYKVTRKELEDAGFGWVFDSPGVEVEEVE